MQRRAFSAQRLMDVYPPRWRHPNKQVVYEVSCPPGSVFSGEIDYSRWARMPLPERVDLDAALARMRDVAGFFDYAPTDEPAGAVEWHANFADPHLFVAYGSSLFAQALSSCTWNAAWAAWCGSRAVPCRYSAEIPAVVFRFNLLF